MTERAGQHDAPVSAGDDAAGDRWPMQQELEQALADPIRRKMIMSTMSHELRSPLLTIRMGSQLVEKSLPPEDEHNRELLQHIRIAAQRLEIMAQNLLQMGRLSTGMLQVHCRDEALEPIVQQAAAAAQPEGAAERVEMDLPPGLTACVDAERLKQVLVNVLSNALKYSAAGTAVIVRAGRQGGASRDGDSGVMIEITDAGPGIEPAHHEAIFQPYFRVDDEGLTKAGAGLGLFIARELVRHMGGDLNVRSIPGQGATFAIGLSAAQGPSGGA